MSCILYFIFPHVRFCGSFRQVLGNRRASEDQPVLRRSDSFATASEVRRELGEEVRPLVSEDARIRLDGFIRFQPKYQI